jgi:REP element-mobilizing transposase RayT
MTENCIPLSESGRIVDEAIQNIPKAYPYVFVEKYVVMPDHVHMLVVVENDKAAGTSISHIISQFKGYVTKCLKMSIWQKSFFDRIIRDDNEFGEVWRYIDNNPFATEKN